MTSVAKFKSLNILSIDPSMHSTGLYYSKSETCATFKVDEKDHNECLRSHLKGWMGLLTNDIDLILIEGYSFGSHSKSVTKLAEVGGIIRAVATDKKIPIIEIPSMSWKKYSNFGKSKKKSTKAEKEDYIRYGKTLYNLDYQTPDEVDATLLYVGVLNIVSLFPIMENKEYIKNVEKILQKK